MIRKSIILMIVALCSLISCAQPTIPDKEIQIATAVMATNAESDRAEATVFGYNSKGERILLRQGSNNLICSSDDPNRSGFQCVCYHKDLEPFMARGRALRADGMSSGEIFETREQEAKAGKLQMPEQPTTLHLLEGGKDAHFDRESGKIINANYRYVVYIPWATSASTGLPDKPHIPGGPWIMDPGTHRAHIMITPPPQE